MILAVDEEQFEEVADAFERIMTVYSEDGIFVNGTLY